MLDFCHVIINQTLPLLISNGVPCARLMDFLMVNETAACDTDLIIKLRLELEKIKPTLRHFLQRRLGDSAKYLITAILSDRIPSDNMRFRLVATLITLAAACLKSYSNCTILDDLLNIDTRIKMLRTAIDELDNVISVLDIDDTFAPVDLIATNGSGANWHLLCAFANPHSVRFSPRDF